MAKTQGKSIIERFSASPEKAIITVLVLSVFYYLGLGNVHLFDWDEINFAECAREMIVTGNYFRVQIDYIPFWEKTPLFFWLQVIAMKIFGVGEFAARLPNTVFGTLTLITLYLIGKKHFSSRFGLLWAFIYFGSLLPHLYFKSGIIDPVFNFFIFLSVYFVLRAFSNPKNASQLAMLGGLASGAAVLTKGPVGFLLLALTVAVYLVVTRFKILPKFKHILSFTFSFLVFAVAWFGFDMLQNGTVVFERFIQYQIELFTQPVAGHEQPFYYHFVVVLIGCFPLSVLAIASFWQKEKLENDFSLWMKCLFWVVIILFSIVTTKIAHYSSMTYLPLSFLAARVVLNYKGFSTVLKRLILVLFIIIGLVLALVVALLPWVFMNLDIIIPLMNDPFAVAGMEVPVQWSGFELTSGIPLLLGVAFGIYFLAKAKAEEAVLSTGAGMAFSLLLTLFMVLPKIEKHTQGSAIEFYESLQGEDVYVSTYRFKSYAHYFYTRMPNWQNENYRNINWLMDGPIDKPVYLVSKITKKDLAEHPNFTLIGSKGGFDFYKREVPE
ncbi:ArnT family glycosyltransferase [Owenweeksia hongkongensis]|uniref:ArnT family glycosyltransferase n=1 Tax=Owenweeksia hongkongensis TaxID=253245 RepID=UPI003A9519AF